MMVVVALMLGMSSYFALCETKKFEPYLVFHSKIVMSLSLKKFCFLRSFIFEFWICQTIYICPPYLLMCR